MFFKKSKVQNHCCINVHIQNIVIQIRNAERRGSMATNPIRDQIRSEFSTLVDSLTNLIKSSKIYDPSHQAVQSDLLDVYTEKMLASCRSLLLITSELKRNALLNDITTRTAQVEQKRHELLHAFHQETIIDQENTTVEEARQLEDEDSDIISIG